LKVPPLDLAAERAELAGEIEAAMGQVLESGAFILGETVKSFEHAAAGYLGAGHAIGVANGTDAMILAMKAAGVGPGQEVVTTPFTFFATIEAIIHVGAKPVFVDIDPDTFNLDPGALWDAITPKTTAVLPVDLYGQPADLDEIGKIARQRNLLVIEDAAQAFGAEWQGRKIGAISDLTCFSFYPTKNLGAYGDGGMVTTNSPNLAREVTLLRGHGESRRYEHELVGFNSRLDALQAAVLHAKLPHLDRWNETRDRLALNYSEELLQVDGVRVPGRMPYVKHVWHQYTIRVLEGRRDAVKAALAEAGIASQVYYPIPAHRQRALAHLEVPRGALPEAEKAADEVLSLPIYPQLGEDRQGVVIDTLTEALKIAV